MKCDRQNFFVVLNHFLPFYPTNNPKIKNFEKWKKQQKNAWRYHFIQVPKIIIICYTVLEMWHMTDVIFIFHFGLFLAHLTPKSQKNQNFLKIEKNALRYHHLTHVYQKLWSDDVGVLRYDARQTDGQTDGNSHI